MININKINDGHYDYYEKDAEYDYNFFLSNFYNVFGRKYIIRVKNEYVPKTREMNRTSFILNG